jgi:hypothetical protein
MQSTLLDIGHCDLVISLDHVRIPGKNEEQAGRDQEVVRLFGGILLCRHHPGGLADRYHAGFLGPRETEERGTGKRAEPLGHIRHHPLFRILGNRRPDRRPQDRGIIHLHRPPKLHSIQHRGFSFHSRFHLRINECGFLIKERFKPLNVECKPVQNMRVPETPQA